MAAGVGGHIATFVMKVARFKWKGFGRRLRGVRAEQETGAGQGDRGVQDKKLNKVNGDSDRIRDMRSRTAMETHTVTDMVRKVAERVHHLCSDSGTGAIDMAKG